MSHGRGRSGQYKDKKEDIVVKHQTSIHKAQALAAIHSYSWCEILEYKRSLCTVDGFKAYQEKTTSDLFFLPDTLLSKCSKDVPLCLNTGSQNNYPWVPKEPTMRAMLK